jgi:CBS domain-containing protein
MNTTARDLMTIKPQTVTPSTGLPEIARLMRDLDIGMLPICDDRGTLVGVVTDRDLVVRCLAEDLDPRTTTVGQLATDTPVTIAADASVDDVLNTMADHQLRRLLVVDAGALIGVISEADIAREGNTEEVADTVQAVTSTGHTA